jgi:predicted transcriptional regulator
MLMTEMPQKRRDKLVIMAEIMDIAKGGALKTQIMYKANLSFSQLNEYLTMLVKLNFLEKNHQEGKEVYISTSQGTNFLKHQVEVMTLVTDASPRCGIDQRHTIDGGT